MEAKVQNIRRCERLRVLSASVEAEVEHYHQREINLTLKYQYSFHEIGHFVKVFLHQNSASALIYLLQNIHAVAPHTGAHKAELLLCHPAKLPNCGKYL